MKYARWILVAAMAAGLGSPALLRADADADAAVEYAKVWAERERAATTPEARIRLARDLYERVVRAIFENARVTERRFLKMGQEERRAAMAKLSPEDRATLIQYCSHAFTWGAQQPETYALAAASVGLAQDIDPSKRLESLQGLERLCLSAYRANSRAVGAGLNLAEVRLELGRERFARFHAQLQAGTLRLDDALAALGQANSAYTAGLEVINDVVRLIRPKAEEKDAKKEVKDFLNECLAVQRKLQESAKEVTAAGDNLRLVKQKLGYEERLRKNPKDTAAADRIVRLLINELEDYQAAAEAALQASDPVKRMVDLACKPVDKVPAADALALAKWYERSDDNPGSPHRQSMLLRQHVYLARYLAAAPAADADRRSAELSLKRVDRDLAKLPLEEAQIKELAEALVAELREPATVVAVAPAKPPAPKPKPPEIKPAEPVAASQPAKADNPVISASTTVLPPIKPPEPEPETRKNIFDFGREGL